MPSPQDIIAVLLTERLPLTAFIANVTRDYHLAEDIFQDICVKAVTRAGEFATAAHVVNWVRVAGRNRAIDVLRARDGHYVGLSEEMLARLAEEWPASSPGNEVHEALEHCIEQVTPNNRELLRLRYFEGRPCAEVAALMGRKLEALVKSDTLVKSDR
jgi:RNA polymerase sigma-70 factor (ECF subfamily)